MKAGTATHMELGPSNKWAGVAENINNHRELAMKLISKSYCRQSAKRRNEKPEVKAGSLARKSRKGMADFVAAYKGHFLLQLHRRISGNRNFPEG
jgi:hypothetical protein